MSTAFTKARAKQSGKQPWDGGNVDYSVGIIPGELGMSAFRNPAVLKEALMDRFGDLPTYIVSPADEKIAQSACGEIRTWRAQIEARRKDLKRGALEYGRFVDDEAARWFAVLDEIQKPIEDSRKVYAERKEAEKQARIAEERRRMEEEAEAARKKAVEEALQRAASEREAEMAAQRQKMAEAIAESKRLQEQLKAQAAEAERMRQQQAEMDQLRAELEKVKRQAEQDRMPTMVLGPPHRTELSPLEKKIADEYLGNRDSLPPLEADDEIIREVVSEVTDSLVEKLGMIVEPEPTIDTVTPLDDDPMTDRQRDAYSLSTFAADVLHHALGATPAMRTEDGKALVRDIEAQLGMLIDSVFQGAKALEAPPAPPTPLPIEVKKPRRTK